MDLPKFHPNERVDLGDVEFVSTGPLGEFQRVFTNLVVGETTKRILDGFSWSLLSATAMQVVIGKAVLAENRDAVIRYGQLVGGGFPVEGLSAQNVSFSGLPIATHGVYVRFVYGDGTAGNRAFWDTVTDLEEIQNVNTRKIAGWQVAVAQNDPGADWYKVMDVAWDGADLATSTITDRRVFLFEGPADSSPQTFRPTWGAGNDRNANRATYGVKTLERFASAVLKKIEEIQSDTPATRWWSTTVECLDKKVSRFGDSTMAGNYIPDATGRDLGSASNRWDAFLSALSVSTVITNLIPNPTDLDLGSAGNRWDAFLRNVGITGTLDGVSSAVNYEWTAAYFESTAKVAANTVFDGGLSSWVNGIGAANNLPKAALQLLNADDTTGASGAGAIVPITFRLGSSAPARDGFDLFAYRNADDDPRLRLNVIVDEAVVDDVFEVGPGAGLPYWSFRGSRVIYGTPTGSTKNTAYANTMIARNVPKAWGTIRRSGAGTLELVDGFNIDSDPTFSGSPAVINVVFASYMASANYAVVLSAEAFTATVYVAPGKNGTGFTIVGWNQNTGAQLDMDAGGNMGADTRINFSVYGLN